MNIQIPERDAPLLKETLETTLKHLLEEIAHATDRTYRDGLKDRYDRLDRVRQKVDFALQGQEMTA